EGDPVVLDFGLARDTRTQGPALTESGDVLGTPAYMAPEQIAGRARAVDRRADVWALGVILYETIARRRPFDAPTRDGLYRAILAGAPAPPRGVRGGLRRALDAIAETALPKDPARRYRTARALADDLLAVLEGRPVKVRRIGPAGRFARWTRRNRALAAAL